MKKFSLTNLKAAAATLLLLLSASVARADEVTLFPDATNYSGYLPIYVYWADSDNMRSEFIYQADDVAPMLNQKINGMTFYLANTGFDRNYNFSLNVSLGMTAKTTFAGANASFINDGMTSVFNGVISCEKGQDTFTVEFETPFEYTGGNLVVDFTFTSKVTGGVSNNNFKGYAPISGEYNGLYIYGSSTSASSTSFYPTVTFDYGEKSPYNASVKPTEINFGKVKTGNSSTQTVKITNKGTESIPVSLSGLDGTPFSAESPVSTLAYKESVDVPVTFTAADAGEHTATMTINLGEAGTFDVALAAIVPGEVDGEIDVADGTATNSEIPFNAYYFDTSGMGSQIIYPASEFTRAVGKQISSIKFFASTGFSKSITAPVIVKIGTTDLTAYEVGLPLDIEMTEVFNGTIDYPEGTTEMTFEFSAPYIYQGGNLVVSLELPDKGNDYFSCSFLGIEPEGFTAISTNNSSTYSMRKFIPHTLFTYDEPVEYGAKVSPESLTYKTLKLGKSAVQNILISNVGSKPLNIALSGLDGTAFSAELPSETIASGVKVELPVTFTPAEGGEHSATLVINLGEAGNFEIPLSGACRVPVVVDGEVTVFDEDDLKAEVPLYMNYIDKVGTGSQVIYPAADFTAMIGKAITGINYYFVNADASQKGLPKAWTGKVKVTVGTTDLNAFESNSYLDIPMKEVFNGVLSGEVGDTIMHIPFMVPPVYNGGNLVVGIETTEASSVSMVVSFRGENCDDNCALYRYQSYSSANMVLAKFHPMTTFTYDDPAEYAAVVMTDAVDFGTIKIGRTAEKSIDVINSGLNPVEISLSGLDGTPFSATCDNTQLASGEMVTIPVVYQPTEGGPSEATLTINLGQAGTFDVALTGNCKVPVIIDGQVTVAEEEDLDNNIPFYLYNGDTKGMGSEVIYPAADLTRMVGKQITSLKYYVKGSETGNSGFTQNWTSPIAVEIGVSDVSEFASTECIDTPMSKVYAGKAAAVKDSHEFDILFDTPFVYSGGNLVVKIDVTSAGGTYQDVYFFGEKVNYPASIASLMGNGYTMKYFLPKTTFFYDDIVPYKASVSVDSIGFGSIRIGKTVTMPVIVKNQGTEALPLSLSSLEGTPFAVTAPETIPAELASGESLTLEVTYEPTEGGASEATLTLNLGEAGTFDVALTGHCKAPAPGFKEITIFEGEDKESKVPLMTINADIMNTGSQLIYPAASLEAMKGQKITSMMFYFAAGLGADLKAPVSVCLGTTDMDALGGLGDEPAILDLPMTEVYNGEISALKGETELYVPFTVPFEYTEGNLVFKIMTTDRGGSYVSSEYLGVAADVNNAVSTYTSYGSVNTEFKSFYPMVTITCGQPAVSISTTELTFPETKIGSTATMTVVLTNTADKAIHLSVSGLLDTPFAATLPADEIAANSTLSIPVVYSPAAAGAEAATMHIDLGEAGTFNVALAGTGVALAEGDTFVDGGVTYVILSDLTAGVSEVSSELTECTIPATVKLGATDYTVVSVERDAFYWSNVTTVVLPETVTEIKYGAFRSSALESITLPAGLTVIGEHAFRSTKLTSIVIPDGVTEIPASAFSLCESLASVTLPAGLTKIGSGAFYKTAITSIVIPDGCAEIESEAFESCAALTSVKLPDALTKISSMLFLGCSSLTAVEIPAGVKEIETAAFENSGLATLSVGAAVEKIAGNSFNGAPVNTISVDAANTNFVVDGGVLYSTDHRFLYLFPRNVDNTVYTVNDACDGIIGGAFFGCNITEVVLPEGLGGIDSFAFCKSDLAVINFPEGMSEMFEQALAATKLPEVKLPEALTYVADGLFAGCSQLTKVTLPATVTRVGNRAFYNCTALTDIVCLGETPAEFDEWESFSDPFYGVDCSKVTVSVLEEAIPAYRASEWGEFFTNFNIYSGVAGVFADGEIHITCTGNTITIDLGSVSGASISVYNMAGSAVVSVHDAAGVVVTNPMQAGYYIVKVAAGDRQLVSKVAF